jgi:hypothetical protein
MGQNKTQLTAGGRLVCPGLKGSGVRPAGVGGEDQGFGASAFKK